MSDAVRSVLALGGNLGDRVANFKSAVAAIDATKKIRVLKVSPLVESHALTEAGIDEKKPNYINGVIEIETKLKPKKLLKELRRIESEHGRVRIERWGSRTLDIDIITYGDRIIAKKHLTVPHPRAYERAFVVVPWASIDLLAVLPGHGKVIDLAETLKDQVWFVDKEKLVAK